MTSCSCLHSQTKTRLLQDRDSSSYSRCGRTDKGVSALGQVVAFQLRSAFPKDTADPLPAHALDALTVANISGGSTAAAAVDISQTTSSDTSQVEQVGESENGHTTIGSAATDSQQQSLAKAGQSKVQKQKEIREFDYCGLLNRVLPADIRS